MIKGATMRLKLWIAAVLVACPSFVFGQGAVLQGGPWTAGHVPIYAGGSTSQNVVMDGGGAAGGTVGTTIGEIGITSRSSTNTYPSATSGGGQLGAHFCMYDAPTTNATGYHWLCLDPNAQGGALIASGAGGGASSTSLYFNVNGVAYSFPFTTGGIVGPGTTVVGDTACWNNTTGTLLKSCSPFPGTTANATATGYSVANQALFMAGTYTGSGVAPYTEFSIADSAQNLTAGTFLTGVNVDHSVGVFGGVGVPAGNRSAIKGDLLVNVTTSGTNGSLKSFSAGTARVYVSANQGGSGWGAGQALGDVYGISPYAEAGFLGPATFLNSVQGAEINVSVHGGSSTRFKSIATFINVNGDDTKGQDHDAAVTIARDATALFDYGIVFGRPLSNWPVEPTGTIIGTVAPLAGSRTAANGVDWNGVTFSGYAFRSTGFDVDGTGIVTGLRFLTSSVSPALYLRDTDLAVTAGGSHRLISDDTGGYLWQINTAVAGDFGTVISAFKIGATGSFAAGAGALATNATNGFFYASSGPGAPTGVPTTVTGYVPLYVDSTNNQLYMYVSGSWKQPKTPAGAALVTWQ